MAKFVKGDKQITRVLRNAPAGLQKDLHQEFYKVVKRIENSMKARVNSRKGNLKRSITSRAVKRGGRAEVGVRTNRDRKRAPHAHLIEFGRRAGAKRITRRLKDGTTRESTYKISYSRPRPFVQPAWDEHRAKAVRDVGKAFQKSMERIARNGRGIK